jgi:hypothetical protein
MISSTYVFSEGAWFESIEPSARELSKRARLMTAAFSYDGTSDVIWLSVFERGAVKREFVYSPDGGWAVTGTPLAAERSAEVKRLTRGRALATERAPALLRAVLGIELDDVEPWPGDDEADPPRAPPARRRRKRQVR